MREKKYKEMRTVGKNYEMEETKEEYMHMLQVHCNHPFRFHVCLLILFSLHMCTCFFFVHSHMGFSLFSVRYSIEQKKD